MSGLSSVNLSVNMMAIELFNFIFVSLFFKRAGACQRVYVLRETDMNRGTDRTAIPDSRFYIIRLHMKT